MNFVIMSKCQERKGKRNVVLAERSLFLNAFRPNLISGNFVRGFARINRMISRKNSPVKRFLGLITAIHGIKGCAVNIRSRVVKEKDLIFGEVELVGKNIVYAEVLGGKSGEKKFFKEIISLVRDVIKEAENWFRTISNYSAIIQNSVLSSKTE